MKRILLLSFLLGLVMQGVAGSIDHIRVALEQGSARQVQEKVYVHTDNNSYFVGDTLWYKAYVTRADNFTPTDMSRLLYVELLTPDGLLVERQRVIVSDKGHTCGQFVLEDSLYSGYYELRAYTRWQLNFNVSHARYSQHDTWLFYNKQMAADYYRTWDGLYSRVLPVYGKPEEKGDYSVRTMYSRPKTRLPRRPKEALKVTFYPEGGHLIEGVENRVAFLVEDQLGQAVNIKGTLTNGSQTVSIATEYMGRGTFLITPDGKTAKASFRWNGKDYSFSLPKSEKQGIALQLDKGQLVLRAVGLPQDKEYGLSVLCRGKLCFFKAMAPGAATETTVSIDTIALPSGVCDLTVFDEDGQILADRLFFVNHHEQDGALITAPIEKNHTYEPYEKIALPIQCAGITEPTVFSLSIRDVNTDETSYDNGNILTDLLLSSELRGFIAYPAYYFENDDEARRRHLDQLMMVQGWRKYKWQELADTTRQLRYTPEKTMTVEGTVCKMLSIEDVDPNEITGFDGGGGNGWHVGTGKIGYDTVGQIIYAPLGMVNESLGINNPVVRKEVMVEAEIIVGKDIAGSVQKTKEGRFVFQVPPFYGGGFLNMKAYKENDSIKKNMLSRKDAKALDERAYPDFYVKRDLFYPMFTHPYNYYENHQPDVQAEELIDTLSELSMENDVIQLGNVNVNGRRRGKRHINWSKPAFVADAYDLYNDITDYGLSFGMLDMRQFPVQAALFLYGNMNRRTTFHVDGRIHGRIFYRNYKPYEENTTNAAEALAVETTQESLEGKRSPQALYQDLFLKRLQDIRVFTDYEPRYRDSTMTEERYSADVTVELVPFPEGQIQPSMRDRHLYFMGINYAEDFYQPDYSSQQPAEPTDYRRTLYWNPNAMTDEAGRFTATFYNNSRPTRIKMTAAGVTHDGRLLHSK